MFICMSDAHHWNSIYRTRSPAEVSWRQASPTPSLEALRRFAPGPDAAFVDVGAGASNLVDALLAQGWTDLTVVDISQAALETTRRRLGRAAARVHWRTADVTSWAPERAYDIWHDRAVFHFLTSPEARRAYRQAMLRGLRPGGIAIVATFAPDGPERCSGLPVRRYDAAGLAAEFEPELELLADWREEHLTPAGKPQSFTWTVFRRRAEPA
jgi:trans-aconitate methyltransferase